MKRFIALFLLFTLLVLPTVGASTTTVCFSPDGGAERKIVKIIDQAKTFIDLAMYSLTSRVLAQAILRAHKRGVKIKIVLDGNDESEYSKGFYLYKRGIDVRYTRGKRRQGKKISYGLMHDKFAVVDGVLVLTGSYNWTVSAEKYNYENLLVVDSLPLIKKYLQEFHRIWSGSFKK